ncbi:hypothetical protein PILCRDRAFT_9562 [Piloderma croceum F 1598]|uniref:Uncharacterized protein n=1 Tax=Piloderma croceum (strain F 1598) TaxID=765440 RepID=A0A0C3B2B9_PILCF|nr:hypothetical protein PILCRDRAFT_9562 [Piloderma croceum F 1598]
MRLAKITEAVGVGHNFIKFGVEMLESSSKDEVPVQRRFKHYFFRWFLTSMKDIADVERVWDESEVMAKDDLNVDYGKLLGEMFGFMMWE